ncbi:MAG: diacylglycerol kinase [Patescibacteria group bacterium]
MFHVGQLKQSFRYAFEGIKLAAHENTFKVLLLAAGVALLLVVAFRVKPWEGVAILLVVMVVLVLEILNTVFERIADLVEPKMHRYVREIKDLMAAAVFIASLVAAVMGIIIFLPHIRSTLSW